MASLFVNQQLPTTSEQAIREFNERYLAVVSAAAPSGWAASFIQGVGAPRVTFPLTAFGMKFRETKAQPGRAKSFEEKSFDLRVVEYDEGAEAPMLDLSTNVFAYRNWQKAPERLMLAEDRHLATKLAALLESGETATSPWDGVAFFHASGHLANCFEPTGSTFGNLQSSTKDPVSVANIQAEATLMASSVLDVNGDKLQANPTEIWLPTEKYFKVRDLLNQDRLANGESNPIKGLYTPVHVPELTDADDWYLVDPDLIKRTGMDPMFAATYTPSATLGLRMWDESSDFYKETGKIKVSKHIWNGFALVFPHAIRKVKGQ